MRKLSPATILIRLLLSVRRQSPEDWFNLSIFRQSLEIFLVGVQTTVWNGHSQLSLTFVCTPAMLAAVYIYIYNLKWDIKFVSGGK